MPPGWQILFANVDEQGYLVPRAVELERNRQHDADQTILDIVQQRYDREPARKFYFFYGSGMPAPEVTQGLQDLYAEASAAAYPSIPAWLGENPPLQTVFIPNGEILCYGPLGRHYIEQMPNQYGWDLPKGESWYRYSAQGELLEQSKRLSSNSRQDWLLLYFKDFEQKQREAREQSKNFTTHYAYGYVAFMDYEGGYPTGFPGLPGAEVKPPRIIAAYDYTGTPVDPTAKLTHYMTNYFSPVPQEPLASTYQTQVRLEISDPAAVSPFAGLPNGPQVVDPTPIAPRQFATRYSDQSLIEVRPNDDPASPYAGSYEAWDEWMMLNVGKVNLAEQARMNEILRERQAKAQQLAKEGKEVPKELLDPGISPDPNDPWEYYSLKVDDAGFILPQRMLWGEDSASWVTGDLRQETHARGADRGHLSAGGVMEPQLLQQMNAARWDIEAQYYPTIPAWLAEQPVYYAALIPNGDVVTLGELGSRPADGGGFPAEYYAKDAVRTFYRYSADGVLIGQRAAADWDWQSMYFPQRKALLDDAKARGLETEDELGYFIVRKPAGGAIEAVFDFDGRPVDPGQPLIRGKMYCSLIDWDTIAQLYAAQQRAAVK